MGRCGSKRWVMPIVKVFRAENPWSASQLIAAARRRRVGHSGHHTQPVSSFMCISVSQ
jgi:hypothetical protein